MTRLIIEKYPSKVRWQAEATRDDTPSYPYLHIEYFSRTLSTVTLFNKLSTENDALRFLNAGSINLNDGGSFMDYAPGRTYLMPQIDIWSEPDKYKEELKRARRLIKRINRKKSFLQDLQDLIIRVRIEFHD